ncbi:MAG: multicopper oxidase domain-containing protein [Planctomycetaceae bacterium]
MDRRKFLQAASVAAPVLSVSAHSRAEGYRRCDQIHDKLTEADIDKWVTPLAFPPEVPTRPVTKKEDVQNPQLGGGSQQIAPEFLWTFGDLTDVKPEDLCARGYEQTYTPRPDDIYRDPATPALQFAELATKAIVAEVIPGWLTRILCYGFRTTAEDGTVTEHFSTPGPTIKAKAGHPLVVRLRNEIDPSLMLDVSMHQHGGHIPAHADGHPNFMVEPQSMTGEPQAHVAGVRDYYYPNPVPKKVRQTPSTDGCWNWEPQGEWDFGEIQNTMWYHDHAEDITAHNALMGLAGYFFLQDAPIPGPSGESDVTGPDGWRDFLPKKQIPLVFKDLCLCPITQDDQIQPAVKEKLVKGRHFGEARIHFDPFDHNGTLGNIQVVNGVAFPYQEVKFDSYWLRMLNASLARFYNLEWWVIHPVTRQPKRLSFLRFGKDSWLFEKPLDQSSVFIGMAARADVCIDFRQLCSNAEFDGFAKEDGSFEVMLVSTLNQRDGRGPGHGDNEQTVNNFPRGMADEIRDDRAAPLYLMKFIVRKEADDHKTWPAPAHDPGQQEKKMQAPTVLRYHHKLDVPKREDIFVRELNFERGRGAWQINKRFYDACIANVVPQLWSTELWILRNRSGGWWHPIHIHLESHQHLFVRAKNHRGERISMCRSQLRS